MKVILFGATGMVGQGALRECLLAGDVGKTPFFSEKADDPAVLAIATGNCLFLLSLLSIDPIGFSRK